MESLHLQDLVSDLCFDNNSIVDLLSDKDLLLFDSDLSSSGDHSAEHGGHIQQGVINFSVSKILNTIEHQVPHLEVDPIIAPAHAAEPEIDPSTPLAAEPDQAAEPDAAHVPDTDDTDEIPTSLSCAICSKPALRYSSYGGQACTSCRSFFRRSARNDVHLNYK